MADRIGYDERLLRKALVGECVIQDVSWDKDVGNITLHIKPAAGESFALIVGTFCGDPYPTIRTDDGTRDEIDVSERPDEARP